MKDKPQCGMIVPQVTALSDRGEPFALLGRLMKSQASGAHR